MAGTRILRVNLSALVGLLRWPFPEGTTVEIEDHALPADATFVRIVKVEDPSYVHIQLLSNAWHGDLSAPFLPPTKFHYSSPAGPLVLPSPDPIIRRSN